MNNPGQEHGAIVTPYEDGPLLVRGDFTLVTPDGEVIDPGRRTVALCRCGRSAVKPFCDGTHKAVGFRAGTTRDGDAPRATDDRPHAPDTASHATDTAPRATDIGPRATGDTPGATDAACAAADDGSRAG